MTVAELLPSSSAADRSLPVPRGEVRSLSPGEGVRAASSLRSLLPGEGVRPAEGTVDVEGCCTFETLVEVLLSTPERQDLSVSPSFASLVSRLRGGFL